MRRQTSQRFELQEIENREARLLLREKGLRGVHIRKKVATSIGLPRVMSLLGEHRARRIRFVTQLYGLSRAGDAAGPDVWLCRDWSTAK